MKEHVLAALNVLLSMPDLQEKNDDETRRAATVMGSGVQRFMGLEVLD